MKLKIDDLKTALNGTVEYFKYLTEKVQQCAIIAKLTFDAGSFVFKFFVCVWLAFIFVDLLLLNGLSLIVHGLVLYIWFISEITNMQYLELLDSYNEALEELNLLRGAGTKSSCSGSCDNCNC